MKEYIFEIIDDQGNVVRTETQEIATCWTDKKFTLRRFIEFNALTRAYSIYSNDGTDAKLNKYDFETKQLLFIADMISSLTGIDPEHVKSMDAVQIAKCYNDLEFDKKLPPKLAKDGFRFRGGTIDEIKAKEKALSEAKKSKRPRIERELRQLKNCTYIVTKDVGKISLKQWMHVREAINDIGRINQEFLTGNFENLHIMLAYIVRPKGVKYSHKDVSKYANIFLDVPFSEVMAVTNFFLGWQAIMSGQIKTYLTATTMAEMATE